MAQNQRSKIVTSLKLNNGQGRIVSSSAFLFVYRSNAMGK
jgi:hypothetical protein